MRAFCFKKHKDCRSCRKITIQYFVNQTHTAPLTKKIAVHTKFFKPLLRYGVGYNFICNEF